MCYDAFRRPAAAFLAAALLFAPSADAAGTLFDRYNGKAVKVHVAEPKDATGQDKVRASELRAAIEKALAGRKSIRFAISSESDADLVIRADVKSLYWTDHDPVDMIAGVGVAAYDAATVESFARLDARVAISDDKGKMVWSGEPMATVTKKNMDENASHALVYEDFAQGLMRGAFGRPKRDRNNR